MRILSEAMMNDPMMTQNLSDLFNEENLAELSAMVSVIDIDCGSDFLHALFAESGIVNVCGN